MSESIYLIYKHISPSGKSYIGLTDNLVRRSAEHQHPNSGCRAFRNAINKYGWDNFIHEVLYDNLTLDESNILEEKSIASHNTLYPSGYNLLSGGKSRVPSQETRELMSSTRKGRIVKESTKQKIAQYRTGTSQTEATKRKISIANKGRTLSNDTILRRQQT